MPDTPLLDVSGLTGGHGTIPVLRGVDLQVHAGEVVGVFGRNGMGKTTLILTLMGLLPPSGGSIRIADNEVGEESPSMRSRHGMVFVPQGRGIFPSLTVTDNLRYAYQEFGDETEEDAIERVLGFFPTLRALLARDGGSLSGGEQQQLALARALMARPGLLLLDEPTEGVQPSVVKQIEVLVRKLAKDFGIAVLLVEQRLDFLVSVCRHIHLLERGQIVRSYDNLKHDVASELEREMAGEGAIPSVPSNGVNGSVTNDHSRGEPVEGPQASGKAKFVSRPDLETMREVAKSLHFRMGDDELGDYLEALEGTFSAYDRVEDLPDELPQVRYPRTPGVKPPPEENRLNAWHVKCKVKGAPSGPLAGREVVLKDNICLAGVSMLNGASVMAGYVPDVDATVATRILDAGGVISGKANCEYYCLSGGSHTCAAGPVHNPYRMGYSSGGSSSGCGALVGSGEIDMAIGGDQGGSVRIPSSWSGCYGMKGTHGLVPYTGAFPIEFTIDTLGPITSNVADNALLLEVIAGADGLDPRQYAPKVHKYTEALGTGVQGMRIGVVKEGFIVPGSEEDVGGKVREAAAKLALLGASVSDVSIPMHMDAAAIWTPIALEGLQDMMMDGDGCGSNYRGLHVTSLREHHSNWRNRADELSVSLKLSMLAGKLFLDRHRGHYVSKAFNISRRLRQAYDQALQGHDLLLMPTLPMKATPMPPADAPLSLQIRRAFEMIPNTTAFSCTGHPAMSVPCGLSEGLPIGMMLVGRYYAEMDIYRAASAFEGLGDWRAF